MPASVAGGRRKIRGPGNLGFGPRLVSVPRIGTIRLGGIGIDKPHRLPIRCQDPLRHMPWPKFAICPNHGSIRLLLGLRLGYRIACAFGQAQDGQAFPGLQGNGSFSPGKRKGAVFVPPADGVAAAGNGRPVVTFHVHLDLVAFPGRRGVAGDRLCDGQPLRPIVGHPHRYRAGKQVRDVLILQIRFQAGIRTRIMLVALLDQQLGPAHIRFQGHIVQRGFPVGIIQAIVQQLIGVVILQMKDIRPGGNPIDPITGNGKLLARLVPGYACGQGCLDVLQGGVHVVLRGELHHALDHRPNAPQHADPIFRLPCVRIYPGIVHNDVYRRRVGLVACGRAGLHQIIFPLFQHLALGGEKPSAFQAQGASGAFRP